MPSTMASALAAPLHDLRARLGTGSATDTGPALGATRDALAAISRATATTSTNVPWAGAAADAARDVTHATVAGIEALAERAGHLGAAATAASDAVARARARIDAIIEEFEATAAAVDPEDPGALEKLVADARQAHDEARSVVAELTAELDAREAAVQAGTAPAPAASGAHAPGPTATSPASTSGGGWSGLGSGAGAAAPLASAAAAGLRPGANATTVGPRRPTPSPDAFGSEMGVQLPGGATVSAPNAVAADAVRHALTQLGVPYDWGGTTPGVGLDCSGLTQWAYGQAGLDLPRLAQEQDVGAAVSRDALRPGDLAVWDGHVAMIVGDGLMVEAGDPVQLSPIRTTNAGQGFQGFWRPTA